jgi:hypothetical protein
VGLIVLLVVSVLAAGGMTVHLVVPAGGGKFASQGKKHGKVVDTRSVRTFDQNHESSINPYLFLS